MVCLWALQFVMDNTKERVRPGAVVLDRPPAALMYGWWCANQHCYGLTCHTSITR